MGKRMNVEGSIFKRSDGRWCGCFYDSKNKRHFVYAKTQTEVKKKLDRAKVDYEKETLEQSELSNMTLFDWVTYYIENYKYNEIKQSTYATYMIIITKHICGTKIGKTVLCSVTTDMLQNYYNEKLKAGYNVKTVKHIHTIINQAMDAAWRLKLINDNVNKLTILPKKVKYCSSTLTAKNIADILKDAVDDTLYPIVVLTLFTGLRKGEVMGLRWNDIDFEQQELHVNFSLCRVKAGINEKGRNIYQYILLEPKTQKSQRVIPLSGIAIQVLNLQKERQLKDKLLPIYNDNDFVFAKFDGNYLDQRQFNYDFKAFLERYNLPNIRFHDLRHTFASLMLEAGESPKVIQELLGHSTITTTMDIYAHISEKKKRTTLTNYEELISSEE